MCLLRWLERLHLLRLSGSGEESSKCYDFRKANFGISQAHLKDVSFVAIADFAGFSGVGEAKEASVPIVEWINEFG
jgi:hypothetical protein